MKASLDQNASEYTQRPAVLLDALGHPDVYLLQGKVPSAQELTPEVERNVREQCPATKCQMSTAKFDFQETLRAEPTEQNLRMQGEPGATRYFGLPEPS